MNGKKARSIRRAYGVKHARLARLTHAEVREIPRWIGGPQWVTPLALGQGTLPS
jgi:hypothetical protein